MYISRSYLLAASRDPEMHDLTLEPHFPKSGCPCAFWASLRRDGPDVIQERIRLDEELGYVETEFSKRVLEHHDLQTLNRLGKQHSTLLKQLQATWRDDNTQPRPVLAHHYAFATRILLTVDPGCGIVDKGNMSELVYRLLQATGAEFYLTPDRLYVTTAPLCASYWLGVGLTAIAVYYADQGTKEGDRQAVGFLTLVADLSRLEHGDDAERWWRRDGARLVRYERFKEHVFKGLSSAVRA